jgi:prepilin-type N-terminal cleavage/methylation domain-containing protein
MSTARMDHRDTALPLTTRARIECWPRASLCRSSLLLSLSSHSAGFTLIEIMLALAILGLIMVMLAGSFHAVAAGKVQAQSHIVLDAAGRAIVSQMANEIRGAVQTPIVQSRVLLVGEGHLQYGRALDSITMSTLDPGHRRSLEDFGSEDTITYSLTPNPKRRGWFLLLRSQSSSLLGIGTGGNVRIPTILAANLLSLHIRYFDGAVWGESWNSQSLPAGRQLPAEVAIDLILASRAGAPLALSTTVTLPMAILQW